MGFYDYAGATAVAFFLGITMFRLGFTVTDAGGVVYCSIAFYFALRALRTDVAEIVEHLRRKSD